jgi:hypothetical protein
MSPQTVESRIITHMNEDHELSLYAMVQSTLSQKEKQTLVNVKNCKLTAISLNEVRISYTACETNSSSQKEVVVPIEPPMLSMSECRPKLVELHHRCLAPKFSWWITEPLSRTVVLSMAGLGYAYYCVDMQELVEQNEMIAVVAGEKGEVFAYAVKISWLFGIAAHIAEAIYAAFICKTLLKMKNAGTFAWFVIISITGYPMMSKVMKFASIQKNINASKKGKMK